MFLQIIRVYFVLANNTRVFFKYKNDKNTLNAFELGLVMCQDNIKDGERSPECMEHRLSINENHEARLVRLEEYLNVIHKYLNETITK